MRAPLWSALLGASAVIACAGIPDPTPKTPVEAEQTQAAVPGPMPGDPPDIAAGPGGPAEPMPEEAPPTLAEAAEPALEPDLTGLIVLHEAPTAGERASVSRGTRREDDLEGEFAQLRSRATGEPASEEENAAPEPPAIGGAGTEGTEPTTPAAEAPVQPGQSPSARSAPPLPSGAWVEFTGMLERITPEDVTVSDPRGTQVVLRLDPGTIPVERGQRVRVLHLDQGEPVKASYVVRDGERVLRTLEVLSE